MTFKSDKQRKAVMAKLNRGGTRSSVKPIIISNLKNKKEERKFLKKGIRPFFNVVISNKKMRIIEGIKTKKSAIKIAKEFKNSTIMKEFPKPFKSFEFKK
ncbi:hypothetical protein CMI37_37155 [Candidatus Pacearchaeota archaeon]|nr:hypothetical protein [Candidatus Pacearchaeota archaeon]